VISSEQTAIYQTMTPEQRMLVAMEWYELSRQILRDGIQNEHPEYTAEQVHQEELKRLEPWYNKNY